jgi:hypothetical protein
MILHLNYLIYTSQKCEVTAVTHCNSPSVPTMLASSVGIKGAVDFIKDIRSLYSASTL